VPHLFRLAHASHVKTRMLASQLLCGLLLHSHPIKAKAMAEKALGDGSVLWLLYRACNNTDEHAIATDTQPAADGVDAFTHFYEGEVGSPTLASQYLLALLFFFLYLTT
jgi:hypothetical protein